MKVLVGECTGRRVPRIRVNGWGRMWIARGRNIYTYPGEPWGLDNGAYRDFSAGEPFNDEAFAASVEKAQRAAQPPYLAVLPDVVGNADATLELAIRWLRKLPDFPWYFVLQDGVTENQAAMMVPNVAGFFLGGTSSFKAEAGKWCNWSHFWGKRFHYGRCGTMEKVAHAMEVGADSIDSAFPMWTEARWTLFEKAVTNGPPQRDLFRANA